MASHTWRPRSAKATDIDIIASYVEGQGWSLTVVRSTEGEPMTGRSRMSYRGLSDSELVDVVDIELAQGLQLI